MVLIIENDNHSHFIKEFVRLEDGRSRRCGATKRVVEKDVKTAFAYHTKK